MFYTTYDNLSKYLRKARQQINTIPILENNEPLEEIPQSISRFSPHLYQSLGAPYGDRSPFF